MDKKIIGLTGDLCTISGIYCCSSVAHGEILIMKGELFPPCLYGNGHDTVWWLKERRPVDEK
jgi:hypothetical protein